MQKTSLDAAHGLPQIIIAIPARLGSTRLPEKPLLHIGGKPMIERVALRAQTLAQKINAGRDKTVRGVNVVVASDDTRILDAISSTGALGIMTATDLKSGTDRIHDAVLKYAERNQLFAHDIVVNIQGDEPFSSFEDVESLVNALLQDASLPMGTLAFKRSSPELFLKSSVVKVVCDAAGMACYFSRAPVPWPRAWLGASGTEWMENGKAPTGDVSFFHHLGVYAFRFSRLSEFAIGLPKSSFEDVEGLEQLRAVQAGWKIKVVEATEAPLGIDTEADLKAANEMSGGSR